MVVSSSLQLLTTSSIALLDTTFNHFPYLNSRQKASTLTFHLGDSGNPGFRVRVASPTLAPARSIEPSCGPGRSRRLVSAWFARPGRSKRSRERPEAQFSINFGRFFDVFWSQIVVEAGTSKSFVRTAFRSCFSYCRECQFYGT